MRQRITAAWSAECIRRREDVQRHSRERAREIHYGACDAGVNEGRNLRQGRRHSRSPISGHERYRQLDREASSRYGWRSGHLERGSQRRTNTLAACAPPPPEQRLRLLSARRSVCTERRTRCPTINPRLISRCELLGASHMAPSASVRQTNSPGSLRAASLWQAAASSCKAHSDTSWMAAHYHLARARGCISVRAREESRSCCSLRFIVKPSLTASPLKRERARLETARAVH